MLPDDAQVITSTENGTQQILQQTPQIQKNNQIIGMDKNNTPIVMTKDTEKKVFNNGETKPIISPPSQTQNGQSKELKPYINPYAGKKDSKSKFGCDYCEEVFPTKYYLIKHRIFHLGSQAEEGSKIPAGWFFSLVQLGKDKLQEWTGHSTLISENLKI